MSDPDGGWRETQIGPLRVTWRFREPGPIEGWIYALAMVGFVAALIWKGLHG